MLLRGRWVGGKQLEGFGGNQPRVGKKRAQPRFYILRFDILRVYEYDVCRDVCRASVRQQRMLAGCRRLLRLRFSRTEGDGERSRRVLVSGEAAVGCFFFFFEGRPAAVSFLPNHLVDFWWIEHIYHVASTRSRYSNSLCFIYTYGVFQKFGLCLSFSYSVG